ncbi:EAL domain-containing protein [Thalassotalea euphylliae]|uniref:cyclic-guanylate-specific phosphodiesterase n=1 Tax=Thalassotalea euphylliae TaxID=1655234 RepID=A0A3E0TN83_9GAMM|nr:EAL domain-containing protein [Thalassotalea euphylliae]REL25873.1 EAL domain-containing protein [Thalassotalea euphylliae]
MKKKLQVRVARTIIFFILTIITAMGAYLTWQSELASQQLHQVSESTLGDALMEQLNKKGKDTAIYMAETLTNALYSYDLEDINQLITAITKQHDIIYAYVYDEQDKLLHDGSALIDSYGELIPTSISTGLAKAPHSVLVIERTNQLQFARNVFIGEEKIGGVVIVFSLDGIRTDISQLNQSMAEIDSSRLRANIYSIASVAIILTVFGSLAAWKITRRLVMPITQLSQYATYIGDGNYDFNIEISDNQDEITELAVSFNQMKDNLKTSSEQIYQLAYQDALTKLPNRRLFKEKLEAAIHQEQAKFAVLFIDIDNFKHVNDNLGHDVGDALLVEVAERLKQSVRCSDDIFTAEESELSELPQSHAIIARIGGDEFTVILLDIDDPELISPITQRIIKNICQPYVINGQKAFVGASIGVATYPQDGTTASSLMKNADIAMYHAKFNGKNQCQFYSSDINQAIRNELAIENDIASALEEEQFLLHYQPKIDLQRGGLCSVEALIRWHHPERGRVSPAEFIPVAENTGLILPMGEWIIETACRQLKDWQSTQANQVAIAINISAIQFKQAELDDVILSMLDKYQLPYHLLEIEVTETVVIENEEEAIRILTRLSQAGIHIWIDDFGTGYSSLGYLRKLPIYGVKIDYSFIRDIDKNEGAQKLCQAIIAMANSLNLKVVAEGIEQISQESIVKRLHCDYAQGFLYGKAQPGDVLLENFFEQKENENAVNSVREVDSSILKN